MPLADEIKGIDEAESLKGLGAAGEFVECVFDIERGDVIRHEHDFVGEEAFAIKFLEVAQVALSWARRKQVDDEVAGAGGGVNDGDAFIAEFLAKFGLEDFFDGRRT